MTDPTTPSVAGGWREHERIFLEPPSGSYDSDGRQWCRDNVWPEDDKDAQSVEFIRADLHAAAIEGARREGWCAGRDAVAAHFHNKHGWVNPFEIVAIINALNPPEPAPCV